jgi:hypothetical protein
LGSCAHQHVVEGIGGAVVEDIMGQFDAVVAPSSRAIFLPAQAPSITSVLPGNGITQFDALIIVHGGAVLRTLYVQIIQYGH